MNLTASWEDIGDLPRRWLAGLALLALAGCGADQSVPEDQLWVAEQPQSEWAWAQAATARMNRGDFAGAAEAFERLIEMDPDEPFNYAYLALSSARMGDGSQVERLMQRAIEVARSVDDPDIADLVQWQQGWAAAGYDPQWTPGQP